MLSNKVAEGGLIRVGLCMSLNKLKPVSMLVKCSSSPLLVLNGVLLLNVSWLKSLNRNMAMLSADKIELCPSKSSKNNEQSVLGGP